jgi:hypothetical protein
MNKSTDALTPDQEELDALRHVAIWVCQPCLENEPGECHTPGCIQWLRGDIEGQLGERLDFEYRSESVSDLLAHAREEANLNGYCNGIEVGGALTRLTIEQGDDPYQAVDEMVAKLRNQDQPNARESQSGRGEVEAKIEELERLSAIAKDDPNYLVPRSQLLERLAQLRQSEKGADNERYEITTGARDIESEDNETKNTPNIEGEAGRPSNGHAASPNYSTPTPDQEERSPFAEVVFNESHELWHLKCNDQYIMADESQSHLLGFAKDINKAYKVTTARLLANARKEGDRNG